MGTVRPLTAKAVRDALMHAKGPNRELDNMLAKILTSSLPDISPVEYARVQRMAFTRGGGQADRFFKVAMHGWNWSIGSQRKTGDYLAVLFRPDGSDFDGVGATPALAMLIGALNAAIYQRHFDPAPASGIEARSDAMRSSAAEGESPVGNAETSPPEAPTSRVGEG